MANGLNWTQDRQNVIWIWDNSAGAYVNNSIESQKPAGTAFNIFEDINDFLYIGSLSRFDLAAFFLSSVGTLGNITWEYYDGSSWITFAPWYNYDFTLDGAEGFFNLDNWDALSFSSTSPHAAAPPDNRIRYYIRASVDSVTTAPAVNQIIIRPHAAYCTPHDVASALQLKSNFSPLTVPNVWQIEDYIANAQNYLDKETRKTWRLNYIENEEHDFIRSGFKLVNYRPQLISRLQIWNGNDYDTKTEGRGNDYFLVSETGMVHYSRFFILPARIQAYSGSSWGWGWGEFSYPVRVNYFYGDNIHNTRIPGEGRLVNDIVRKLAAIDVYQSHDNNILTVTGADKIALERRVDNWQRETEERIDKLLNWEIF